ncbi:DUF262 domain-containing protein [Georgenia sp. M64]|uniref:GmrSD restriction endonuclease domain-containing protein n=1 Tax=Georgenia sp. M64 TaxID=3120520 RepID=UPI0030E43A7D
MGAIFKPTPWQVDQLVSGVQKGSIRLPDLQRPFVWPATKVRDLFDSMYRGYPVGELMFWDVTATGETRAISGPGEVEAAHQIVDGQQRLTSLYAAMKGLPVRDEAYRNKSITISFNPFTEKFDVRSPVLARSVFWVEDISTAFYSPIEAHDTFVERFLASGQDLSRGKERELTKVFVKLDALRNYSFQVVHIQSEVEKRTVADIFVRINSEGVSLKAYDYILTWLSVFWPEGRDGIEHFARNSRISPDRATEIAGMRIDWTPKNPFLAVETGHVVRAMVAVGQNRAKLLDAYAALQAKDRSTGVVDPERQERELNLLQKALPIVTDRVNWTEFVHAVQSAGFRSNKGITSNTNLVYSYVIFLLGRNRFGVDLQRLRSLIARWVFMSQMTSRYTGSGESQLQRDLDAFGGLTKGDSDGFERLINQTIKTTLTDDFWSFNVPQLLVSSSTAFSPIYQCYLAALNTLNADMFMLRMPVREWMDPTLPAVKGLEGHHLFPRAYQEAVLDIHDTKRINQVANFAPTDWATNIRISDRPPAEYWPDLVAERGGDEEWLARQYYWHALPDEWQHMRYDDFLEARRERISEVIRDAFAVLSGSSSRLTDEPVFIEEIRPPEPALSEMVGAGILKPGDLLDPVDPEWVVDAVISDDGTVLIDGIHEFDSLDDAAWHLGVTNLSGFEFWALERDGGTAPLSEVVAQHAN